MTKNEVINGLKVMAERYKKITPKSKSEQEAINWGIKVLCEAQRLLLGQSNVKEITNNIN